MNELPQTLSKETVTELCEVVVQVQSIFHVFIVSEGSAIKAKRLKVGSVLVKLAVDLLIKWKKVTLSFRSRNYPHSFLSTALQPAATQTGRDL